MPTLVSGKPKLTPKKYHGYAVFLFIMGTLFPPLAVAARFGISKDFWINLLLTICGYIPGHGHNFYIQNIRNNKTHNRTPKWAQKWGLVDTSEIKRKERRSQWATRYNDRLPNSTLEGRPLEEGQEAGSSSIDLSTEDARPRRQANGELWRPEDENYYNNRNSDRSSSGRWHYPANFDDAELTAVPKKGKKKDKKDKKDRWTRTQEAYSLTENEPRKKKSRRKKNRSSTQESFQDDSVASLPEDPEGGLYGNSSRVPDDDISSLASKKKEPTTTTDDIFNHQF